VRTHADRRRKRRPGRVGPHAWHSLARSIASATSVVTPLRSRASLGAAGRAVLSPRRRQARPRLLERAEDCVGGLCAGDRAPPREEERDTVDPELSRSSLLRPNCAAAAKKREHPIPMRFPRARAGRLSIRPSATRQKTRSHSSIGSSARRAPRASACVSVLRLADRRTSVDEHDAKDPACPGETCRIHRPRRTPPAARRSSSCQKDSRQGSRRGQRAHHRDALQQYMRTAVARRLRPLPDADGNCDRRSSART